MKQRSLPLLFIFVVLGSVLVWFYLGDPWQNHFVTSQHGFGIDASSNVTVTSVAIALENWVDPPLVSIGVSCKCPTSEFNVMISLPFTVTSGYAPWPWTLMPAPTVWNFTNDGNGASIVYSSVQLIPPYTDSFQTSFPVTKDYLTSKRGIETMVIQLDTGFGGTSVYTKLFKELNVSFVSLRSLSLYVVLPASARDIQAFPETSSRKPLPQILTGNTIVDSIEWDLNERKTITLSYVDEDIAGWYDATLIVGSIMLGAGVSEGLDFLIKSKTEPSSRSHTTINEKQKPRSKSMS